MSVSTIKLTVRVAWWLKVYVRVARLLAYIGMAPTRESIHRALRAGVTVRHRGKWV